MQTDCEGVFACGNVLHVHDLVDYVSAESERAGKNAADYVLNGGKSYNSPALTVKNGANISYTVPQTIHSEAVEKGVDIFFRVRKNIPAGEILVMCGDERIASYKRDFLMPAEMQKITLPKVLLDKAVGEITISATEREA
jgi:hypothetical protein